MPRKSHENPALNANFSDLTDLAARQVEAFLEAQSALTQAIQEAGTHWTNRLQTEGQLATDLVARLSGARTMPEAAAAWQEWTNRHAALTTEDVKRLVEDGQALWTTTARAFTGGWAAPAAGAGT